MRQLGHHELLQQTADGVLVLGWKGEHLVNDYRFYAAFTTPEEYRLVCGERTLGSLPINFPLLPQSFLIFAGRRWEIVAVHEE